MQIFDIKRFAINDGPGIRTTIFFSGCPLRCVWCHNPESWELQPKLTYKHNRCIGCQSCVRACQQGALMLAEEGIVSSCTQVGSCMPAMETGAPCTEACPSGALGLTNRRWHTEQLLAEVEKERDVMEESGGGVTISGGEPLMQGEQLLALLDELGRHGFHRTVDTTLHAPAALVEAVAAKCELMLIDLKVMDREKHILYTGVANDKILSNIRLVSSLATPFFIRIPLIEGVNADRDNIEATATFLSDVVGRETVRAGTPALPNKETVRAGTPALPNKETVRAGTPALPNRLLVGVNLLPYHDMGIDKHRRLWSVYNPSGISMATPSETVMQRCVEQFAAYGINATVGG